MGCFIAINDERVKVHNAVQSCDGDRVNTHIQCRARPFLAPLKLFGIQIQVGHVVAVNANTHMTAGPVFYIVIIHPGSVKYKAGFRAGSTSVMICPIYRAARTDEGPFGRVLNVR